LQSAANDYTIAPEGFRIGGLEVVTVHGGNALGGTGSQFI
jgi:hypothetical protein